VPQSERKPEQIQRDIAAEREKLTAAFDDLGNAVDDAVNDLQQTVAQAGRRALVVAPALAAAVATLIVARRRRKSRKAAGSADPAATSASDD
jgi:hypothetical protein